MRLQLILPHVVPTEIQVPTVCPYKGFGNHLDRGGADLSLLVA
jgi:hypothetical protein